MTITEKKIIIQYLLKIPNFNKNLGYSYPYFGISILIKQIKFFCF